MPGRTAIRFQLDLFGSTWVFVSEVGSSIREVEEEHHEVLSSLGFQPNEEEEDEDY